MKESDVCSSTERLVCTVRENVSASVSRNVADRDLGKDDGAMENEAFGE